MTIEQAIEQYDGYANVCKYHNLTESQKEFQQIAAWLRILKKAKFEYDEAWRIITNPTPDVRYPDINRAKIILDVFGNSLGLLDVERRTDVQRTSG